MDLGATVAKCGPPQGDGDIGESPPKGVPSEGLVSSRAIGSEGRIPRGRSAAGRATLAAMAGAARLAALVRILAGVLFGTLGAEKILGDFVHGGFASSVRDSMMKSAWPFWRTFLESTVLPHASVFAWAVAAGEAALGIALLIGFLTRAASIAGAALMLTILLGQSYAGSRASWDQWVTAGLTTKFALLLLLLIAACDAGRTWGIDGRQRGGRRGSLRR